MAKKKARTEPLIDNQKNPNATVRVGPDLSTRVAVQVDRRTTVYAKPGNEAESEQRHREARQRMLNNFKS